MGLGRGANMELRGGGAKLGVKGGGGWGNLELRGGGATWS